ncbi:MAG: trypsin-like serine protease [Labilithrix sp.]|nr:trypsin-like serine protease [Labilithrix sp.]
MRRAIDVACLGVFAFAFACSGRDEAVATRSSAQAIVSGTPDATRPDVLVLLEDASSFRCTATLIAPNLVITARHCVGKSTGSTALCRGDATDDGAQALPVYAGNVDAAPMFVAATPSTTALARAKTIYDDGATTTCGHDVALIELDRKIAGIVPAKLRRTPLAPGALLVVMGFGWIDRNQSVNATERMRGSTNVLALGPTVHSFKPFGDAMATSQLVAVGPGEIAVSGVTTTGDSGGPGFDAAGDLATLVARGYGDPFYGPGTFTSVAAHLATIDDALTKSGNPPTSVDAGAPAQDAGVDAARPEVDAAPDPVDSGASAAAPDEASGCAIARASRSPRGAVSVLALSILAALAARRAARPRSAPASLPARARPA